jgi:oxalate decarboxylase/phosphoglucose isomerase-like protein (cupin superfamily)
MWIPKGIFHGTVNTGNSPLHLVVAYIPAGSEQVLRDIPGVKIIPPDQR